MFKIKKKNKTSLNFFNGCFCFKLQSQGNPPIFYKKKFFLCRKAAINCFENSQE